MRNSCLNLFVFLGGNGNNGSKYQIHRGQGQHPIEDLFFSAGNFEHARRDEINLNRNGLAASQRESKRYARLLRVFTGFIGFWRHCDSREGLGYAHVDAQLALQEGDDVF